MKKVRQLLRPLSEAPLQAYLDNRVQLFDIIEMILSETGPAEIYISTFSTSEEFLRRIYRLKRRGQLTRATMLADLKASRKTVNLYTFIANVFDEVYLSENHSKVILIQNARWQVSICTSQNQTRGNRVESGIITTDPAVFIQLRERYAHIINTNAIQLDGLFNGTT
ncbi:C4-dicarboxylate ABC transporter [Phocaeicola dorei]|uniref:C4-dicarboxylate ABC transporter n=1 Tax=Phocaeicola dorei TaxID=357276 RepID=UPI0022E4EEDE|nr:C4-dicarboxylate ABC transporter [Phocaeicola dorei]